MDPRQTGLAPSFVRLASHFGGGSLPTIAHWSLLRVLATGPPSTAPSQYNERVRRSADSYLEELKAEAARMRGASPWEITNRDPQQLQQ
jgi:hypothetical protein